MAPRRPIAAIGLMIALFAVPGMSASEQGAQDRTIAVSGDEFSFDPSTIEVEVGQNITFEFTNDGNQPHDFGGDFGRTDVITAGESDSVTATFDETGDVAFWCDVPGHREQGMEGTIQVQASDDGADNEDNEDEDTPALSIVALLAGLGAMGWAVRRRG